MGLYTMPRRSLSLLDLIDLPEEQSRVALHLVENNDQTAQALANALSMENSEVEAILESLLSDGYISRTADGLFHVDMGKRRSQASSEKSSSSFLGDVLDDLMKLDDE